MKVVFITDSFILGHVLKKIAWFVIKLQLVVLIDCHIPPNFPTWSVFLDKRNFHKHTSSVTLVISSSWIIIQYLQTSYNNQVSNIKIRFYNVFRLLLFSCTECTLLLFSSTIFFLGTIKRVQIMKEIECFVQTTR